MKHLYPRFYDNIKRYNLITPDDTVISGFSGGKDSVTLLLLLERLQEDIKFDLKAAYFNHRLRADSGDEEKWVENFLDRKKIDLIRGTSDVIAFRSRNKLNLEHAASLSRYDFFNKIADRFRQPKIATGHSSSDLTETFFIKLFRGSGLQGLSAIYGLKGERIIRPLLIFTKLEISGFLERSGTPFFSDPSNRTEMFLRNNIRNNLMPEIEKIEPAIDRHIFRTVSIVQEEYEFFRQKAGEFLRDNLICGRVLSLSRLKKEPLAVRRHIIREFIRRIKGNLLNINFDHIEQLADYREVKPGFSIPGINFSVRKGFIYDDTITLPEYNYPLNNDGTVKLTEICSEISAVSTGKFRKPENNFGIILPAEKLIFPMTVRNPASTDKYMKIHSSVKQKVFEMIRGSGYPAALRNLLPVVVNGDGVPVWVAGSPLSDQIKVVDKNGKYIQIRLESPLAQL